ncbi:glycosyltransferase family 4 protein [Vibrio splendidus]|uniref:glycosyltransferase family 4 protein n=1 Tax=Vibrio splendidus TaxID=29497 RepID=UPI000769F6A8|nr:glycosyltransferase family 4 protein [Vibrio splendidus]CAH6817288.1 hypothetical protein VCHA34P120_130037 [Vibrio chagasii]
MKVINMYSGNVNAQTGIGTVLHTLHEKSKWSNRGIEYNTISLDGGVKLRKNINVNKSILKIARGKVRTSWWKLAENHQYFSKKYVEILYLKRAREVIENNISILEEADVILVNDLWSILTLNRYYSNLLVKCCYVNHSDGELAGFIKEVFKPLNDSVYYNAIELELESILGKISHLMVLSELAKFRVLEKYPFMSGNKISVIYNGFSPDNNIDVKINRRLALHVSGTLCSRKRQYLLVPIMYQLKEYDIELHVYGSGPDTNKLVLARDEYKLKDKIQLHGYYEKPYSNFEFGDLFILLSKKEGFPMAAVEATSRGCPLILTNAGGARELIEMTSGVLIEEKNDNDVIKSAVLAIKKYLDDRDMRLLDAEKAKLGFEGSLTSSIMIERYIDMCFLIESKG